MLPSRVLVIVVLVLEVFVVPDSVCSAIAAASDFAIVLVVVASETKGCCMVGRNTDCVEGGAGPKALVKAVQDIISVFSAVFLIGENDVEGMFSPGIKLGFDSILVR